MKKVLSELGVRVESASYPNVYFSDCTGRIVEYCQENDCRQQCRDEQVDKFVVFNYRSGMYEFIQVIEGKVYATPVVISSVDTWSMVFRTLDGVVYKFKFAHYNGATELIKVGIAVDYPIVRNAEGKYLLAHIDLYRGYDSIIKLDEGLMIGKDGGLVFVVSNSRSFVPDNESETFANEDLTGFKMVYCKNNVFILRSQSDKYYLISSGKVKDTDILWSELMSCYTAIGSTLIIKKEEICLD